MSRFVLLIMMLIGSLAAFAAAEPAGAGFAGNANEPVHGWTLSRDPDERDFVVIHIPPRRPTPGLAPMRASPDGAARGVVRLKSAPTALAAIGPTAYLTFEPTSADAPIPVMAVTAVRTSMTLTLAYADGFLREVLRALLVLAPLWWLCLPAYGWLLVQVCGTVLKWGLGMPILAGHVEVHGILNTESLLIFLGG